MSICSNCLLDKNKSTLNANNVQSSSSLAVSLRSTTQSSTQTKTSTLITKIKSGDRLMKSQRRRRLKLKRILLMSCLSRLKMSWLF